MYRFPAPVSALNVNGITARTCPRKTNGAFPANSRTSAIDGGNIRRPQSWVVNKNREQLTKTTATQTRCVFGFHTASEPLRNLPDLILLVQSDKNISTLGLDPLNVYRVPIRSGLVSVFSSAALF